MANRNALVVHARSLPAVLGRQVPRYLTPDEVRTVIDAGKNLRDKLLMETLWQCGMRISEALALTAADIDFHTSTIKAITLKRRRPLVRILPIKAGLLGLLGRYLGLKRLAPGERLFPISRSQAFRIVQAACRCAGIDAKRSHCHIFRHSFSIAAVISGVPPLVLNELLGHSDLSSTLIYTKILAADARTFIERMPF